jgi:hypothetical protein
MYSSLRRTISRTIPWSCGSQARLAARPYWPASTRTAPSSSTQEKLLSPWTIILGIKKQISCFCSFPLELDFQMDLKTR